MKIFSIIKWLRNYSVIFLHYIDHLLIYKYFFQNRPDIHEINNALEEFDSMLHEYEKDKNSHQKENLNTLQQFSCINFQSGKNSKAPIHSSTPILNNRIENYNNLKTPNNNKPAANSILSLVNNNNNKCDNTLKKRNALVTFEFKTLLDKVSSSPTDSNAIIDEELKLNNEITGFLSAAPFNYNDQFHLNISHQTQSPPSLSSSSSSTTSSNNSTSSASYSSQHIIDNNFQSASSK